MFRLVAIIGELGDTIGCIDQTVHIAAIHVKNSADVSVVPYLLEGPVSVVNCHASVSHSANLLLHLVVGVLSDHCA